MAERELSILVRAKGAVEAARNIGKVDSAVGRLSSHAGRGLKNAAANIASLGVAAAAVSGGVIVKSITAASDLAETQSKVGVVFREQADQVLAWGKTSAAAMGMSQNSALGAAATYGNLFVAMGLANDKSAQMSKSLVEVAGDLASFNNMDPTMVLEKLRSGLTGEFTPLKELGVNINETILKAKALEMGLVQTTASTADLKLKTKAFSDAQKEAAAATKKYGANSTQALKAIVKAEKAQEALEKTTKKIPATLDPATKAQAAYALIMEQTATAQGDFDRTSKGLANQQRIFKANLENTAAIIGTALLPKVSELMVRINEGITSNQPTIERLAGKLPALFDRALAFATAIPWNQVGSAFKLMGAGADAALTLFTSMPPWVQTAVLTGWGLNKLTGGAVGSIVGELGKGLIKGVLGMQAGVVNIQAGVVNGPGGGGPPVPPVAPVGTAGGLLATAATIGAGTLATLIAAPLGVLLATKLVTDATDPGGVRNDQGRLDTARARGVPEWNIRNGPANPERFPRAGRGGLSPDDRQARNDQAKIGLLLQRQGERGGAMQTALEKAQVANERYAASTAPSIKSMDMNMSRLLGLQQSAVSRDVTWQTQLTAAINRLATVQGRPPVVNVTVPVRTVTNNQTRLNRVANRPPGRGPTID